MAFSCSLIKQTAGLLKGHKPEGVFAYRCLAILNFEISFTADTCRLSAVVRFSMRMCLLEGCWRGWSIQKVSDSSNNYRVDPSSCAEANNIVIGLLHNFILDCTAVGVAVRSGHLCTQPLHAALGISASVRASLYIYNTPAEVEVFISELKDAIKFFS